VHNTLTEPECLRAITYLLLRGREVELDGFRIVPLGNGLFRLEANVEQIVSTLTSSEGVDVPSE